MAAIPRCLKVLAGCAVFLRWGTGAEPALAPGPEDVPVPEPASQSLAGDPLPDITRFLKVRRASQPELSPDGRWVTYLTTTTGQPQLWRAEVAGGATRQLTFLESSVTFQSWSPAGDWIAYGTDRDGNEREGFYLVSPDGFEEREVLPPSEHFRVWGGWSPDGRRIAYASTERNGEDFDIYTVEVASDGRAGPPRRVHEGSGGLYATGWSRDGRWLVLSQARGEADNDLSLLDWATGTVRPVFRPADASTYRGVQWSRDGQGFYLATNQDRDWAGLAFQRLDRDELQWIERPDAEVEEVALSEDGRYLAWTVQRDGYSAVRVRDLERDEDLEVSPLPRGTYGLRWARRRGVLLVQVTGPRVPGDVWVWEPRGAARRVTHSDTAGLRVETFVEPESIRFSSFDGETVFGLLYRPAGAGGGRSPVLIHLHGGPTAQSRPEFDPVLQYLLTRGMAILDLNYRGSTGYGKRYTRLDDRRLRLDGVRDIGAAVDWLRTRSDLDAARVAVMGGSYGGYLTCAALTEFPDRFRAGVNLVGVVNWIRALEEASPQLKASDVIEYGDIDDPEDRRFFESISPIRKVDRVAAPMLVVHGANDPRVPVGEADEWVAAIRARGGEVRYLRFPDEGHGIRRLSNKIIAYRRIAAFLQERLGQ